MDSSTPDVRYVISGVCLLGAVFLLFLGHKPDFALWRILRIPVIRWARLNRTLAFVVRAISVVLFITAGTALLPGISIYALWFPMIAIPLLLSSYFALVAFSSFHRRNS